MSSVAVGLLANGYTPFALLILLRILYAATNSTVIEQRSSLSLFIVHFTVDIRIGSGPTSTVSDVFYKYIFVDGGR